MENYNAYEQYELRAFAGEKGGYYEEKWKPYPDRFFGGVNVAALFAGGYWLIYRRLYKELAIYLGVGMFFRLLTSLFPENVILESTANSVTALLTLGVFVFGNALYREKFRRALKRLDAEGVTDPDDRANRLEGKGGPWKAGVWLMIGAAVLSAVLIVLLG